MTVDTTFFFFTNGMVFGDRLEARAAKGRVFLLVAPGDEIVEPPEPDPPIVIVTQALESSYDITPGSRVTVSCGANGNYDLTYIWQMRKADNSGWITANETQLANEYPDASALVFEPSRQGEPAISAFQINLISGPGPTQFRCRIRDTSPEGEFVQKLLTTTLNYIS